MGLIYDVKEESAFTRDCQSLVANRRVLGTLLKHPNKLEDTNLNVDDFPILTQKIIFAGISNVMELQHSDAEISSASIMEYYKGFPAKLAVLQKNDAMRFMEYARETADEGTFESDCTTIKKYHLLRELKKRHFDITYFFNQDADLEEAQTQAQINFENAKTLDDIIDYYQSDLDQLDNVFNSYKDEQHFQFGDEHLTAQRAEWKKGINQGMGYASKYLTAVTHGIKAGKYMVTSAGTGVGKSRLMLANMCYSFLPKFWNEDTNSWEVPDSGGLGNVLYIGTEMDLVTEVQGMTLSYMCGIDYDKIVNNTLTEEEDKRIEEASNYINPDKGNDSGIFFVTQPNFSISWIEKTIRRYYKEHNIVAVFFDYMYSSSALKSEYSAKVGPKAQIADYQVLQDLSVALKDIANRYKIYIETATQVSGEWHDYLKRDSDIVRGAKGVIDKADRACILSVPEAKELELISDLRQNKENGATLMNKYEPNRCLTIYKNRDGRYNAVKIWLYFDTGKMRIHDLFCTDCEVKAVVPIRKVRSIFDPSVGKNISMTIDEAKAALSSNKIDKSMYEQIRKMERKDPSFPGRANRDEKKILEGMKQSVGTVALEGTPVEDDFDTVDW